MKTTKKDAICITSCPGGSNVSLMSYKAASILDKEGVCTFVRISGEKARKKDAERLLEADQKAEKWILLDGCEKGCGLEALSLVGIAPDVRLIVTNFGIERENKIDFTKDELEMVVRAAREPLKQK